MLAHVTGGARPSGGAAMPWRSAALIQLLATSAADPAGSEPARAMPTQAYFDEYSQLYDHIGMLRDNERMTAYHEAIMLNGAAHFQGKTVLDVGAGTGILSIWAAQAGAKKVYAVEATGVAKHAEALVRAHGFDDGTVEVLRGRMEDLELPTKVDVIISEWMGYFLLRESMAESVLLARDRWLKPGGAMYPSSARILVAALDDRPFQAARDAEIDEAMASWKALSGSLAERYGLKLDALNGAYQQEHDEYVYRQAWQGGVPSAAVQGEPHVLLDVDMHNTTFAELFGWQRTVELPLATEDTPVHALVGWFDVRFCAPGSATAEVSCVELDTSPRAPYTHWGHTALLLRPPLTAPAVSFGLGQSRKTHHDLNLTLSYDGGEIASYEITNDFKGFAEVDGARVDERDEEADDGHDRYDEADH